MKAKFGAMFLAMCSTPVWAAPQPSDYVGLQAAQLMYDESGIDEVSPTVLIGRFGHHYSRFMSLEGRVGFGIEDDSVTESGTKISLEIEHLVGLYGVGHLPFGRIGALYALAGVSDIGLKASAGQLSDHKSDSGFSYGLGLELNLGRRASLTVEYTSYLNTSDYDITAVSAGANVKF